MKTTISIVNLVTDVDIGIYPHEIGTPQAVRFDVDITLRIPPIADEIAHTLDYDDAQRLIIALAQAQHYNLLETLCSRIVNAFNAQPIVAHTHVRAQKLTLKNQCEAIVVQAEAHSPINA